MFNMTKKETKNLQVLRVLTYVFSVINMLLLLATIVSSCLGWLSWHGWGLITARVPYILSTVLYTEMVIYWHFWYVVALPAFFCSLYLYRCMENKYAKLAVLNVVMVLILYVVKILYGFQLPD